jgi:uncharacterized membrane protein
MSGTRARTGAAIWLAILCGGLGIVALATAAPALRLDHPRISALIYAVFAPLCHQAPERCFHLQGFPMAVCARCAGIYAGFAAGALLYPALRGFSRPRLPSLRAFLAVSAPIGLDVAGNVFLLWRSPNGIRFLSGLIWGLILPFFVIPAVHDLILTRGEKRRARIAAPPGDVESS